ncbi:MAG: UDP-glucose 4-epimerase [uncultured Chloroflexi bacterium]|uniref:UDP-glucose 4-epimerase n=1 Tax=uncultured Chloroflexota bacterium TaxID=166587 RepID=A0A6J4HS41_9CHLR|nr:MAG: UDP-glucose 4-epimerase [uncultured Chloroflexota bacterium]
MKAIITGGAGFIGCNAAARFLGRGNEVVLLDNLSRRGADRNYAWLEAEAARVAEGHGGGAGAPGRRAGRGRLTLARVDVREREAVEAVFGEHADAEVVLHLAGQVAVTTSVADPRSDFEVNALGSFNVLEAARRLPRLRAYLYTSTNKVYGGMEDVGVIVKDGRYAYGTPELVNGVPETQPLDFHSPYGCSKGAADQYTIDYARIYGLPAVALRQSCIYGPRQMGVEDQGWVAWFCIAAALGRPITLYGDGMQVRDALHVSDLLDAYDRVIERIERVKGQALNLGGGPQHTVAIAEVPRMLERALGRPVELRYDEWRPGDQRVFVSDIRKAQRELDWTPEIGVREGVEQLFAWVQAHTELFQDM